MLGGLLIGLAVVLVARTLLAGHPRPPEAVAVSDLPFELNAAAARLGEAIRFETVSIDGDPEASRAAFDGLRDWLSRAYPRFHALARRSVLAGGTLLYEWPGSDPALAPIILMAHQDVVPAPSPDRWRHPPFAGLVRDGVVWGRGSIDNKGSLIAMLEAAEALAHAGHAPRRSLFFVFGHDEETTGKGARAAAQRLVARGLRAAFVLDEGSLVIADHPVTRAAAALIGVAEKGVATVVLTAQAPGGHASAPPRETAVGTLARAIDAILDRPFPTHYGGATRSMLWALAPDAPWVTRMAISNDWLFGPLLAAQIAASPQGAAMLRTTVAPTMLRGSPKHNVLPTEASATINVRIAPGDTVSGVMTHLRSAVRNIPVTLELTADPQEPSPVSSPDNASFALLAGAVRAVFDVSVAPAQVIAATDSRSFVELSHSIYRFQPLRLTLAGTGMIHGVDEHVSVAAFGQMIRFFGTVIQAGTTAGQL